MIDEWGIPITEEVPEYIPEPKKGKNVFDIMMSAFNKKFKPTLEEKESIPEFLFHQVLSNDPKTTELALMFTTNKIPVSRQYDIVRMMTGKCFIPYPKKLKNDDEVTDKLSEYFQVNLAMAGRYREMMTKEQVDAIINKFNTGRQKVTRKKKVKNG